jgi:hypothetical protein
MQALRAEFKKRFAMPIEGFLPLERLMPLDGTSADSLLFGSAVAVRERCLIQADLARFVSVCPEGYFLIGFRTQEPEGSSFSYMRRDGKSTVYLRIPWVGSGHPDKTDASCAGRSLLRFREFEREFSQKIASLIAIEVMGEALYEVMTVEGRRYRLAEPLKEADCRVIFDYPVIVMPDDIQTVKKLQRKLKEYRQRIAVARQEHALDNHCHFSDAISKISILEAILLEGEVSTYCVARELAAQYPQIDPKTFRNACAVMEDYCGNGGRSVWGGTGLL